jgi:hypothetical protein
MRPVTIVLALLWLGSEALAEDGPVVPPPMKASIEISKALSPTQKIATLEEGLNKETDRRVEMEAKVESLNGEITRLQTAQVALNHDKSTAESELGKTREALARAQRDFEALRAGYAVVTKIIGYSFPVIAALVLFLLVLIGWLLFVTRRLAVRVHDMPTVVQIQNYQAHLAQLQEQITAEKHRNAQLKERLAMLGVVD